jgi:hypothetical protein
VTLPGAWSGLPDLHNLAVNTERNGQRHWTECTQSSCIMAAHNWRPEVPVTNAERDALDATPPHRPLTGTTVRERDACLQSRYGWAGARANGYGQLWGMLAAGWVGVFAGSGIWPTVTDFTGNHALAIGPVAGNEAWIRDPLHPVGHWAPIADIEAWSWDAINVALFPPNDPQMIVDLMPTLGIQLSSPGLTVGDAYATVPPPAPQPVPEAVAAVSVAQPGPQAATETNWGLVVLAALALVLAYLMTRKDAETDG